MSLHVQTIDLHFKDSPKLVAAHVWNSEEGLVIVDCGPSSCLEALEAGLKNMGATWGDVRHLLLTHIHLDHAGAAGHVLRHSPKAKLWVHPRGLRHLLSPERLMASATRIYGDATPKLWGDMPPCDPERSFAAEDGEVLQIGHFSVQAIETVGHAQHHHAWRVEDQIFAGDVAGVRFPGMLTPRPPTPPPDLQPELWKRSGEKIRALGPELQLRLTHFGQYKNDDAHWDGLFSHLDELFDWVKSHLGPEDLERDILEVAQRLEEAYGEWLHASLEAEKTGLTAHYKRSAPLYMDIMGVVHFLQKQAQQKGN